LVARKYAKVGACDQAVCVWKARHKRLPHNHLTTGTEASACACPKDDELVNAAAAANVKAAAANPDAPWLCRFPELLREGAKIVNMI
jgi:hypothetical protein